jgi:hypothetical protein
VQGGNALVRNTYRINAHQVPEDGAVRRKTCSVSQNVFESQPIVPSEFNTPAQRR